MNLLRTILLLGLAGACWHAAAQPRPYTLDQLLVLAQQGNKGVEAVAAGVDAARAGLDTAAAYPNPEVEFLAGDVSARQPSATAGATQTWGVTQRIDLPNQRQLRGEIADKNLQATLAGQNGFEADLAARVKRGYYGVLRRESEAQAAEEDLALTQQLYDRAQVRVNVGDAPKYEAIRMAAELLNAQKNRQSAHLRVTQAKSFLRQQVGGALPPGYAVGGQLRGAPRLAAPEVLREALLKNNPELLQRRAELARAQTALDYERSLRWPSVALRASVTRDPDVRTSQMGVTVGIPLWDRRKGPVDEAAANVARARSLLEAREFELAQELDEACQQFQIAASQVESLESGIVRQADAARKVAEDAYRYGERGIIDYLDAQRVLRVARTDLIAAQYDLQVAAVEIERLLAALSAAPTEGNN